ncbi:MAG: transposase family protein [Boseongicola sp. SB0662_bin_57]|nr:transposase family protein [Boseongicola sp. SB0662_bin_57]
MDCPFAGVYDNLKSGVARADREEPQLNPSFREFARHYGLAILPAQKCRPKHKAAAESAVKTVQSRVLLPLRNETFFSLGEINAAIRSGLDRLNDAPTAKGKAKPTARAERPKTDMPCGSDVPPEKRSSEKNAVPDCH